MTVLDKTDVEAQLLRAIEQHRFRSSQLHDTRKLCITVWVALLVAVGSEKLGIVGTKALVLLVVPTLMFWMIDALHGSILMRLHKFICSLEERLAFKSFESDNPIEIYVASVDARTSIRRKISVMFDSLLRSETTAAFYLFHICISLIFVIYLAPSAG